MLVYTITRDKSLKIMLSEWKRKYYTQGQYYIKFSK